MHWHVGIINWVVIYMNVVVKVWILWTLDLARGCTGGGCRLPHRDTILGMARGNGGSFLMHMVVVDFFIPY